MSNHVFRLYTEKKPNFNVGEVKLLHDIKENLGIDKLIGIRIINRYDIEGINEEEYKRSINTIFSEPPVDNIYEEKLEIKDEDRAFVVEYLPGQYDQRADSAAQCLQILTQSEMPVIRTAKVVVLEGEITDSDFESIKKYYINALDSRETSMSKPRSLNLETEIPNDVESVHNFIQMNHDELQNFMKKQGLAMSFDDIKFCQNYFKKEQRNPTITEIKVIDTYWSDHCRHTTFETVIKNVCFEDGELNEPVKKIYEEYLNSRKYVYEQKNKEICLMDIATIGMKELRKRGKLEDLDVSDEINACSIKVDVEVDGNLEKWLVMFKNETHNHPTEIEPFGGASTCLGGAIRDPLSGRSYVYQAMRVTGCADPRIKIEDTLPGKLPQRKITKEAARGYSSYGNQIGLATGHVAEIYHKDYVAKRMEVGAVIAAAPYDNVIRKKPKEGDSIILLGGRTGRDGCGGASGSSKEHNEESLLTCGAEVQKGNPPTERKIQRLFRNSKVTRLIKKCNDFGAGGVSVAIGELAEGLFIDLDLVPKKYEGLDGTELAISESQERMAVVVDNKDAQEFIRFAEEENLEAVEVAKVTSDRRLKMLWRGNTVVDISRDFLDTNGVRQSIDVKVAAPLEEENYFNIKYKEKVSIKEKWINNLSNLNVCCQKGLVEMFDSSIGAGSVLMPFGGEYQLTPSEAMAAKIPLIKGETKTGTLMAHGYNPYISKWSPFHGAVYAVIESAAKIAASGGDYSSIRLTFQEYFEKLGEDSEKWGKPFSALLGAFYAQKKLEIPAIGGKDSMSGTFKDINVPPTLISFAVNVVDVNDVISPEFKKAGSKVILLSCEKDEKWLPKFDLLKKNFDVVSRLIKEGKVLAAHTIKHGGISEAVSKMCFGNKIGFKFTDEISGEELFVPNYGSIALEILSDIDLEDELKDSKYEVLGYTQETRQIEIENEIITLEEALNVWSKPLEEIFPTEYGVKDSIEAHEDRESTQCNWKNYAHNQNETHKSLLIKEAKPTVFIPVFPGTNCEYDTAKVFEKAGANVETMIFNNLSPEHIIKSVDKMTSSIDNSQIIMLPGGFSAGDEPDGSGKFIATIFRNPKVSEAVMNLIKNRDGLMLGICNGFQALIKLGLLPYGEIREICKDSPTLTYNKIGRHVSCMVQTKIVSNKSPWLSNVKLGDIHTIPVSHGEGRFAASMEVVNELFNRGQIATQYVDFKGNPSYDIKHNPNGSICAIEGITSEDGRIFGKMGHSERIGNNVCKNIIGEKDQRIFEAGVNYFK